MIVGRERRDRVLPDLADLGGAVVGRASKDLRRIGEAGQHDRLLDLSADFEEDTIGAAA